MTSKERKTINWPSPLRTRDHSLGVAVREYAQSTEETRAEAALYPRVLTRVARPSRRVPIVAAGLVMAGMSAVVLLMVLRDRAPAVSGSQVTVASRSAVPDPVPLPRSTSSQASPPAARSSVTPPAPAPSVALIRLAAVPASLPAGKVDLDGQAMAFLSADAVASGRTQAKTTEVALSRGSIELHVIPRAPGHDFAVSAGPYRFTVVGTAFTVSQTPSRLELSVSEGTVAVWRGTRHLAIVGAGEQWAVAVKPAASPGARLQMPRAQNEESSAGPGVDRLTPGTPASASPRATPSLAARAGALPDRAAAPALAPPPAAFPPATVLGAPPAPAATPTPAAAAADHRDCGQLAARKHAREALTCYQDQAAQNGLAGETAQYQLARLWRDSLGDLASALAAFQTQRSRFPDGALRTEADLSIIELLPRLGRHADALAESEQFLIAHPKAERRGEIHLLRGNIFREVLRDLDHAEREYARGAESSGRAGDDSRFLHAVCLEALGRVNEARTAYEAYLLQSKATHAQEAKSRLERLRP